MSSEVFETPEPEESFEPYRAVNTSARQSRTGVCANPEVEAYFHDKSLIELDEQAMPVKQAFEVFMGKVYKPTLSKLTEYEFSASRDSSKTILESPLARFMRLSLEIKELEADLMLLATDAEQKKHKVMLDAGQEVELNEVMQGLHTLQLNLSALEKNAACQPFLRTGTAGADAALSLQKDLTTKFFQQIDAFKRHQQKQTNVHAFSEGAPIVYEIYSNGELNAVDSDAKTRVSKLEARITALEKAIGNYQGQELRLDGLCSLSGATSVDLTSTVAQLEQRVALMSEKNLDAVKTRTTALVRELTLLTKLKQSPSVQGALNSRAGQVQIQKIHDQLSSLDTVAASVPAIVDRLISLKSVHDEVLNVTARVGKIERTQASLIELLDSDAALLANVEASLADNVQIFQSNILQLDNRMAKLLALSSDR
ncbi:unnamed protein product [Peronospora belbahrii]|uniref:Dynactin subunit 2 n=1 Tax=Peronospora belbahrii TaxID=622444 RepID=A0ABN8CNY9_9STRA|nr:unnamed protein product [Peronospora belbahrii]